MIQNKTIAKKRVSLINEVALNRLGGDKLAEDVTVSRISYFDVAECLTFYLNCINIGATYSYGNKTV